MKMTKQRYNEIEKEIERIINKIPEVEHRRNEARMHGDFRENATFDISDQELAELISILSVLQEEYANAEIIQTDNLKTNVVQVGSQVKIEVDGEPPVRKLISTTKGGDYFESISDVSKLGIELLGKHIGDIFSYEDALGEYHTVKVIQIV